MKEQNCVLICERKFFSYLLIACNIFEILFSKIRNFLTLLFQIFKQAKTKEQSSTETPSFQGVAFLNSRIF